MKEFIKILKTITVLLCTCLSGYAQENADSTRLQTACVPVMSVAEDSLVFQAGESLSFAHDVGQGHRDRREGPREPLSQGRRQGDQG